MLTMQNISNSILHVSKRLKASNIKCFSTAGLPDSVKRVGNASAFPNEYPGQNYEFNWALNFDGVTPLKESAFRITKPLDVKIAGLTPLAKSPLKVNSSTAKKSMLEAGSDSLSFETFDEVSQRTKDLLSLSDTLYCPEGFVPGTRTLVRVITNSSSLPPKLVAYLDRAPKKDPPKGMSITAYVLEGTDEDFNGYAIEEVVEEDVENPVAKSVASVVVVGKDPKIENIAAGLELSVEGLLEDEAARKAEADGKATE